MGAVARPGRHGAPVVRVAVQSPKGGVGKSTLALALAAGAALEGQRVLLVDADPDGTVTAWADARKRLGMPLPQGLEVATHAAPDLHKWVPDEAARIRADVVVIDGTPRSDEALTRSTIAAADRLLIPMQASLPDLWRARSVVRLLREAAGRGMERKAAFVLSRFKPGTNLGREFSAMLAGEGVALLPAGTTDRVAFAGAVSAAQTIFEYEPRGAAADEARALLAAVRSM